MASSRKSSFDLTGHVGDVLSPLLPADSSILLGLSGGVDSIVLLHLLQHLSLRCSWRLSALHVHHGISPQADVWAVFCADLCALYGISLQVEHVDIAPLRSLGLEAAARKLRHAALAQQRVDFIALAHHLDDQAETLLLQLLRGAGVRGASAMPTIKHRANAPTLVRPLLNVPRSILLEYAQQHSLQWVEDESNADDIYPRNFLRHRILPLLEHRFPAYRKTLLRSAQHFAEATELLDELAQQDADGAISDNHLDIKQLRMLGIVRGKNLLRYFLAVQGAAIPDSTRLQEILRQLCNARQDAQVCINWQGWQMRRYRNHAYTMPTLLPPVDFTVMWNGEEEMLLPPPHGMLYLRNTIGQGISVAKLQLGIAKVRSRRGGETIRVDAARPQRDLRNLLQEHEILPWQRDLLPLLFCDTDLVCIPGIGIANAYRAQPNEVGVIVIWRADLNTGQIQF
ncbi:tRNA(Ile)-lysidine synthase [Candidatus Nitrotoga sp. HW29]|uniref:tRNA lysidine(34) synthetase TilS n=1 Tax=Candidatus Nitrotoga sp. HW29 TaxID=2886963 RepID=UPI001EF190BA|nr:tRNA lysidine(34) synthetase TilS [Candidatus Nitrotoga sp. HW29]CAH1905338.1 tRNA(Ile)-lysidine synthase [Candidatus Nitrotoga sp. HW29]